MSDDVRLRWTPFRARGVSACCPSGVCVCVLFTRTGRCARSHRTGLCQHAFPKGDTSVRRRRMTGHTLPQPLCAQYQDPEPLALSWPASPRPRQLVVSAPASRTSLAKASCCAPYRPMPEVVVAPDTLAGGIPSHLVAGWYST